jgi:hypothetical protein
MQSLNNDNVIQLTHTTLFILVSSSSNQMDRPVMEKVQNGGKSLLTVKKEIKKVEKTGTVWNPIKLH